MEKLYLGAYWGDRRESVESCAERLGSLMTSLASISPCLATWFTKPAKGSRGSEIDHDDRSALCKLMLAGTNNDEFTGAPIGRLGFSVGAWNGDRAAAASLSIACGIWAAKPEMMNAIVLSLPLRSEAPALYELPAGQHLMRAVAEAWDPDWITLTSSALRNAVDAPPRAPSVGWLTYLGPQRSVPTSFTAAQLENPADGAVLIAAPRSEDVEVTQIELLVEELRSSGALAPTPV